MHITQIIIENFKSYSGRHVIDNLDRGHNAIVGANGSGKSSLLEAITFILTSKYCPLMQDKRRELISNGPQGITDTSKTAAVEIILNNEDKKLPHDDIEICIKRTINDAKKDTIKVNNRLYTQTELRTFLQCAFSQNNPYYIVEQDEIAHLALASDIRRFEILAIAAGVDGLSNGIPELLHNIQNEKVELRKKKKELEVLYEELLEDRRKSRIWHSMDKTKRYLQHQLLAMIKRSLEEDVERKRAALREKENDYEKLEAEFKRKDDRFNELKEETIEKTECLDELVRRMEYLNAQSKKLTIDIQTLLMDKERLQNEVRRCTGEEFRNFQDQMKDLNANIADAEEEERMIERELREAEKLLAEKRKELFQSEQDKNEFLRRKCVIESIRDATMNVNDVEANLSLCTQEISSQEKNLKSQEREIKRINGEIGEKKLTLQQMGTEVSQLKRNVAENEKNYETIIAKRNDLLDERKELQRKADDIKNAILELEAQLIAVRNKFQYLLRRNLFEGIESMKKIIKTWIDDERLDDVEGIQGLLIDHFSCENESIQFIVEIVAGEKLFNYVIRDREVLRKVLIEMKKQKLPGIISCIPLANIEVKRVKKPSGTNVISLCDKLKIDEETAKAVEYVFGRTMIAKNLKTASELNKQYPSIKFITLEGDQICNPGEYRGGFIDRTISRCNLYKSCESMSQSIDDYKKELKAVENKINAINMKINGAHDELEKKQFIIKKDKMRMNELNCIIEEESKMLEEIRVSYEDTRELVNLSIVELFTKKRYTDDLRGTNEAPDTIDISIIDSSIDDLRNKSRKINDTIQETDVYLSDLQLKLQYVKKKLNILHEQEAALKAREEHFALEQFQSKLALIPGQITKCKNSLKIITEELASSEVKMNDLKEILKTLVEPCESADMERQEAKNNFNGVEEALEELQTGSREAQLKLGSCNDEIDNLGPIPRVENAHIYEHWSRKQLERKIHRLIEEEEALGPVTRNSGEHFNSVEQALKSTETLEIQMADISENIKEMLQSIGFTKILTLEFYFKHINEYFQEIFREIVPNGIANLEPVWQGQNGGSDDDNANKIPWDKVIGICINASFSEAERMRNFLSFSGGQKTIIALVFIFAIQRLNPAPFYLFDEIDKALDGAYRQAVAQLIKKMSRDSQLLTITFRKELLRNAEKFFRISALQGVSHLTTCTKEEAEEIVATHH